MLSKCFLKTIASTCKWFTVEVVLVRLNNALHRRIRSRAEEEEANTDQEPTDTVLKLVPQIRLLEVFIARELWVLDFSESKVGDSPKDEAEPTVEERRHQRK